MRLMVTTVVFGVLILGTIIELLRRRRLREKYAVIWLVTGCLVMVLAVFPGGLNNVAGYAGVASGASLVLFLAVVFLLIIGIHLSWEVSQLEEETRSLSEEIALLRIDFEQLLPDESAVQERRSDDSTEAAS